MNDNLRRLASNDTKARLKSDLPRLVQDLRITQVVITIAEISRSEILRIIDIGQKSGVKLRIMPGLFEILQGKVQTTRIGNVRIEDLLGRDPVSLDEEQIGAFLSGKVVLVTGAGGSVGSDLARQVARFGPAELLLVEAVKVPESSREIAFAISTCICIVFTEVGRQAFHGDLSWQLGICNYLLFLVTLTMWLKEGAQRAYNARLNCLKPSGMPDQGYIHRIRFLLQSCKRG